MSAIEVQAPNLSEVPAVPPALVPSSNVDHKAGQETVPSASDGGVYFDNLADGAVLELETKHHRYTLVKRASGEALISGHPVICPEPVLVKIEGSARCSDPTLKAGFIGCGMQLIFEHPTYHTAVFTSRILSFRQIA